MKIIIMPNDHELFEDLLTEIKSLELEGQEFRKIKNITDNDIHFNVGNDISGRLIKGRFKKDADTAAFSFSEIPPAFIEFLISFGSGVASGLATVFILNIIKKFKDRMTLMSVKKNEVLKENEIAPLTQDRSSLVIDELLKNEYYCNQYLQNELEVLKQELNELKKENMEKNLLRERSKYRLRRIDSDLKHYLHFLITLTGALNAGKKKSTSFSGNIIEFVLLPNNYELFAEIISGIEIQYGTESITTKEYSSPDSEKMFFSFKVGDDVEGMIKGGGSQNCENEKIPNTIEIALQIKCGKDSRKIAEWANNELLKHIGASSILSIKLDAHEINRDIPEMQLQWLVRQLQDTQINIYRLVNERLFAEKYINTEDDVVGLYSYKKELKKINDELEKIIISKL